MPTRGGRRWLGVAIALASAGCLEDAYRYYGDHLDGGADAGWADSGAPSLDAGLPDAGTTDAGAPDAGVMDAGTSEGADAGPFDAGARDAGSRDSGFPDAGHADSGLFLLGDEGIATGSDSAPGGTIVAFQFMAVASGTAATGYYYAPIASNAGIQFALYSDDGGLPGTLLSQATFAQPFSPSTWGSVPLPPVPVTAGMAYWIATLAPAGDTLWLADNNPTRLRGECASLSGSFPTFPATWDMNSVGCDPYDYGPASMYVTSP